MKWSRLVMVDPLRDLWDQGAKWAWKRMQSFSHHFCPHPLSYICCGLSHELFNEGSRRQIVWAPTLDKPNNLRGRSPPLCLTPFLGHRPILAGEILCPQNETLVWWMMRMDEEPHSKSYQSTKKKFPEGSLCPKVKTLDLRKAFLLSHI